MSCRDARVPTTRGFEAGRPHVDAAKPPRSTTEHQIASQRRTVLHSARTGQVPGRRLCKHRSVDQETLDFYATPGRFTTLDDDSLCSADIQEVVRVVQGL